MRDARTSWNTRTVPSVTPTYTRSPLGAGAAAMGPKPWPCTTDTFADHRTAHVSVIAPRFGALTFSVAHCFRGSSILTLSGGRSGVLDAAGGGSNSRSERPVPDATARAPTRANSASQQSHPPGSWWTVKAIGSAHTQG